MKNLKNTFIGLFTLVVAFTTQNVVAQDIGADVVSSYVWRGSEQLGEASVQAYVSHSIGDKIEVGVWTNNGVHSGLTELDPYISANIGPVSVTATNYTYAATGDDASGMAQGPFDTEGSSLTGLEISGSTQLGPVSLLAGYFLDGEDMYVEAGFNLAGLDLAVGMGDNGYTDEGVGGGMALVNVSIAYEKSIGSLPAFGQLVYNPDADAMFVVFGISL
jgi:hypothetical protein